MKRLFNARLNDRQPSADAKTTAAEIEDATGRASETQRGLNR
jgi:hypothetical protein